MLTELEYEALRLMSAKQQVEIDQRYRKKNGWASYPSGTAFSAEIDNDDSSAIEVYEFVRDKPEKYFLYINEKEGTATTWIGDILGTVSFGTTYRAVFGDKRQHVRVYAINGKTYSGIYYKS